MDMSSLGGGARQMGKAGRFSEAQQVCFCFGETAEGPAVLYKVMGKCELCPIIVTMRITGPVTR